MKEKLIAVVSIALVLVFALSTWSSAQSASQSTPRESRTVTVTGDADVRVVPDEVILTLGIETWDKNMDVAKRQNDDIVTKVLALAGEHGIAPEHIQTDYVSIEPRYRDNGYYEQRDFIGFFVRKTVVLTLGDLAQFEDVLSGSLAAGVNYVHGIEFRTTELRKYRDEARALAIKAAEEKAAALAGELGQKVGDPLTINEDQSSWWSAYNAWWGSQWSSGMAQNVIQEAGGATSLADSSVAPGQIKVNARVTVSFELTE